jgi:molybdate transport system ATP-binding protein/molybdate/tungstate transport system ATP-binding protein
MEIQDVHIKVEEFKLDGIDLKVDEGQYFILLGTTGVGKTILLETLAGIHRVERGRIYIDSQDVTHLPPEERRISYVPQDYALFPNMNVRENIGFGLTIRRVAKSQIDEEVVNYARRLGISHLLDRAPQQLSGGEKQRVALARALIIRPRVLLMDEPLAALDRANRSDFWILLKGVQREFGVTVIHVTHDLEEAFVLGERIGVFIEGRIVQSGTKEEIYKYPNSLEVARFLGIRNIFRGIVQDVDPHKGIGRVTIKGKGLTFTFDLKGGLTPGEEVDFLIRPEEVMVIREGKPIKESLKGNIFEGEIRRIIEMETHHTLLLNEVGQGVIFEVEIPNYVFRNLKLIENQRVKAALRRESLWIIPGKEDSSPIDGDSLDGHSSFRFKGN